MALARDRYRDVGSTRLARWLTRGLMTLGGTGVVLLASAGFAASASADDDVSLFGEVVAGVAGVTGKVEVETSTAVPAAAAVTQEPAAAGATVLVSREVEPVVRQAVEPPARDVVPPSVPEVAQPGATVIEPAASSTVEPVVHDLAPVVEQLAASEVKDLAPVVEQLAAPAVKDLAPVVEQLAAPAGEHVLAPAVHGVLRPVVDTLQPDTLVTDVMTPVLPPAPATGPASGLAPEVDIVPLGTPNPGSTIEGAALADALDPNVATPNGTASTDVVATSEAARSRPVAMSAPSPLLPAASPAEGAPGSAAGDSSSTTSSLPGSVPASSGSAGPLQGAGSADADLARGFALPANNLSLSPAAAPPTAFLEVLLEISVAPD